MLFVEQFLPLIRNICIIAPAVILVKLCRGQSPRRNFISENRQTLEVIWRFGKQEARID